MLKNPLIDSYKNADRESTMEGKTVLVTGGAGAIGSQLVRHLANSHRVVVIDDLSSGHRFNLDRTPNVEFIEASILDTPALEAAFARRPETVFHLAAHFANQNSVDHPERDLAVNGTGTLRLLEACKKHHTKKFIYASSSCVYGSQEIELKEELTGHLETPYAITKLLGEQYVDFYSRFHGINSTTLRFFNSFGPGELPGKYRNVIPNFLQAALSGEPLIITGTGEETRSFSFVGDVVKAVVKSSEVVWTRGEIINIGTTTETTVQRLAETIKAITGSPSKIFKTAKRPWDTIQRRRANMEKAKRLLGWTATTSLEQGLKVYADWLKPFVIQESKLTA